VRDGAGGSVSAATPSQKRFARSLIAIDHAHRHRVDDRQREAAANRRIDQRVQAGWPASPQVTIAKRPSGRERDAERVDAGHDVLAGRRHQTTEGRTASNVAPRRCPAGMPPAGAA